MTMMNYVFRSAKIQNISVLASQNAGKQKLFRPRKFKLVDFLQFRSFFLPSQDKSNRFGIFPVMG